MADERIRVTFSANAPTASRQIAGISLELEISRAEILSRALLAAADKFPPGYVFHRGATDAPGRAPSRGQLPQFDPSPAVALIQEALDFLGLPVPKDGNFEETTERAVYAFQQEAFVRNWTTDSLTPSGAVDAKTYAGLIEAVGVKLEGLRPQKAAQGATDGQTTGVELPKAGTDLGGAQIPNADVKSLFLVDTTLPPADFALTLGERFPAGCTVRATWRAIWDPRFLRFELYDRDGVKGDPIYSGQGTSFSAFAALSPITWTLIAVFANEYGGTISTPAAKASLSVFPPAGKFTDARQDSATAVEQGWTPSGEQFAFPPVFGTEAGRGYAPRRAGVERAQIEGKLKEVLPFAEMRRLVGSVQPDQVQVQNSSWLSLVMANWTTLLPLILGVAAWASGVMKADPRAIWGFLGLAAVGLVAGAWLFNESKKRAFELTKMLAANRADPAQNDIALVSGQPPKEEGTE